MITLPGLIDPHVHLRYLDPHKEDFLTSTFAALAGGFTMVLDMPNNNPPITTLERLKAKMKQAKEYTRYDIGFHFGSLGDNLS
jgi:dihydroorotase